MKVSPPDLEGPPPGEPGDVPRGLAEVGVYPTQRDGLERCLVVLAMGLPCWLVPDQGGLRLLVDSGAADAVSEQLRRFEQENAAWPPAYGMAGVSAGARPAQTRRMPLPQLFLVPLLWALGVVAGSTCKTAGREDWSGGARLTAARCFPVGSSSGARRPPSFCTRTRVTSSRI